MGDRSAPEYAPQPQLREILNINHFEHHLCLPLVCREIELRGGLGVAHF